MIAVFVLALVVEAAFAAYLATDNYGLREIVAAQKRSLLADMDLVAAHERLDAAYTELLESHERRAELDDGYIRSLRSLIDLDDASVAPMLWLRCIGGEACPLAADIGPHEHSFDSDGQLTSMVRRMGE